MNKWHCWSSGGFIFFQNMLTGTIFQRDDYTWVAATEFVDYLNHKHLNAVDRGRYPQ